MSLRGSGSQRLIVLVGASGAGKDSVLRGWLDRLAPQERPALAQRTITRPAGDPTEQHEPIDDAGFHAAHTAGAFALAWQANGLHYGVRWREFEPLRQGRWVVMNGSRAHLPQLRAVAPAARVVEVAAAPAIRAARLALREREDGLAAQQRLARTPPAVHAELVIHNDGALGSAVDVLHQWWHTVQAAARECGDARDRTTA